VVGTFSKSRSLAGARLGFVIGNKELIADIKKVKYSFNPYNVNSVTQALGESAILDRAYFSYCLEKVIATRERSKKVLEKLNFTFLDSKANFILAKSNEIGGEKLYLALKDKGFLVRHFSDPRITDFVRITIGTDKEMDLLFDAISEILKEQTK
jgi:histidinol-phosphate aminotransferase